MLIYLSNLRNRFFQLLNGVSHHSVEWTNQAETPVTIQGNMDSIDEKQAEIDQLEYQLSQKKKEARLLEKSLIMVADTIENKAIGFHTAHTEELKSYGISLPKPKEKKPIPSAPLAPSIKDDVDGVGFILSTTLDPNADRYEWQRGVANDAKDVNTIPAMQLYKSTRKLTFVDENVVPGLRYFYRVRAINATGEGAYSPIVNKVQS